jgi:TP901 family phage tail tape measure protein
VATREDIVLNVKGNFTEATRSLKRFGDQGQQSISRLEKSFSTLRIAASAAVGFIAARAFTGLVSSIGDAARSFREFSSAAAEINSILPKTAKLTEDTKDELVKFSSTFGTSAAQQAKAFYQIVSAGISDATEATELLAVANEAAVAGVTDITTSVNGLTSALATFKDQGIDTRAASDILFTAVREGKTTFGELASNIGKVAPLGKAAGASFAEIGGALAFVTKIGLSTEEATTGIRAVFAQLIKQGPEVKKTAKDLGIEFSVAAIEEKGFAAVIKDVIDATGGQSEAIASLFPNIRALNTVLAISKGDFTDFERILNETANATGATADAFAIISDSADFQLRVLGQTLSNLPLIFTKGLDDPLAKSSKNITQFAVESIPLLARALRQGADTFNVIDRAIDRYAAGIASAFITTEEGAQALREVTTETLNASSIAEDFSRGLRKIGKEGEEAGKKVVDAAKKIASQEVFAINETTLLSDAQKSLRDEATKTLEAIGKQNIGTKLQQQLKLVTDALDQSLIKRQEFEDEISALEENVATEQETKRLEQLEKDITELETRNQMLADIDAAANADRISQNKATIDIMLMNEDEFSTIRLKRSAADAKKKKKQDDEIRAQEIKDEKAFFSAATSLANAENKTLATIGKAAAITQIALKTPEAVGSSFAFGARIGGPPLGFLFGAIPATAMAAQATKIAGVPLATGGEIGPGFPNDTFPARLTSGERVLSVPENQSFKNMGEAQNMTNQLLASLNNRVANLEMQTVVNIGNREIVNEVNSAVREGRVLEAG